MPRCPSRTFLLAGLCGARPGPGRWPLGIAGLVVAVLLAGSDACAQRSPDTIGIGVEVGTPGGLSAKIYRPGLAAYDALLTTDLDDRLRLTVHRVWERPLPESPLYAYVGPGMIAGLDALDRTPLLRWGVSGKAGLNFYAERFEVFLHVTPRLRFLPTLEGEVGGGVGLRYYF